MKWRTVLCTALFLCGTVLLSACGGGEMPAPAEPPASSGIGSLSAGGSARPLGIGFFQ